MVLFYPVSGRALDQIASGGPSLSSMLPCDSTIANISLLTFWLHYGITKYGTFIPGCSVVIATISIGVGQ